MPTTRSRSGADGGGEVSPASPPVHANKWVITFTVMLGTFMSVLDTSIVNVALPYMRGNLSASVEEITWVATGYMLSTVCVMPTIAFLGSRFGRKRFYIVCIGLFTATSMLCGLAWDLPSMVLFRALQGIGGGALMPVSQAILRETFPPEEQGMAMGLFGLGVSMGPAFGPTLGGWLTDSFSWPWIFYINVPVGVLNILLVGRYIQDPPYLVRTKGNIDVAGLALLVVSLPAIQIILEKGQRENWFESPMITHLTVIGAVALGLFVWRELTAKAPVVDLRILKDLTFTSTTIISGVLMLGLYGSVFILPLFVQQILGYPAMDAGLLLMPRSLAIAFAMLLTGRIYNRFGAIPMISGGLLLLSSSFWMLSRFSLSVGYWDLFFPQVFQGIGLGVVFVALSTEQLAHIDRHQINTATGVASLIRTVFSSIGIALCATLFTRGISSYRAVLVENVSLYRDVTVGWERMLTGAMVGRGLDAATAKASALKLLDGAVMRQASMLSFNHVFVVITVLLVLSSPLFLLLRAPRRATTTAAEPAAAE